MTNTTLIKDLDLSIRAKRLLINCFPDIENPTLGDLKTLDINFSIKYRCIGKVTAKEILTFLENVRILYYTSIDKQIEDFKKTNVKPRL